MGSNSVEITKIISFIYEKMVEYVSFIHHLKHQLQKQETLCNTWKE